MANATLYRFQPPYHELHEISHGWQPGSLTSGTAIVWRLDANNLADDLRYLEARPRGSALMIVLPPPNELASVGAFLPRMSILEPHAVLPSGNLSSIPLLKAAFALMPMDLSHRVTSYLYQHRILTDTTVRTEIRRIIELAPRTSTIAKLCRIMSTTRRTLGRHFEACNLPVPSHWLQFARLLHVVLRAQSSRVAMFRLAVAAGYPDGFTMSNQLKRLIGLRPTEVRGYYGFEWILERWLEMEASDLVTPDDPDDE